MAAIRPTKKQRELLEFIAAFINQHGYSPSYREIMAGCNYTSVATVALHVRNLIARGHLVKRDRSARSLEVVRRVMVVEGSLSKDIAEDDAKWLVKRVDGMFAATEAAEPDNGKLDELFVLVGALKILGMDGAVQSFIPRISALKQRLEGTPKPPPAA